MWQRDVLIRQKWPGDNRNSRINLGTGTHNHYQYLSLEVLFYEPLYHDHPPE